MELGKCNTGVGQEALDKAIEIAQVAVQTIPTYADLIAFFEQNEVASLSDQQIKNRKSALNQFLQHSGISLSDPIEQEFGELFEVSCSEFLKSGKKNGKKDGTLANQRTLIGQWLSTWTTLRETLAAETFDNYGDCLQFYVNRAVKRGLFASVRQFCIAAGYCGTYLGVVKARGLTTHELSRKESAELEKMLQVPAGTFLKFGAYQTGGLETKRLARGQTKYQSEIRDLIADKYTLTELTPRLRDELKEIVKFKTSIFVAPLTRNESWRLQGRKKFSGVESTWELCSPDGKNFTVAALMLHTVMKSFFGFLEKSGMDKSKFSIAYMTDSSLALKYIEFMKERRGKITKTAVNLLTHAGSLIYSKGGYLYQHSKFAALLPTPIEKEGWNEWCVQEHAALNLMSKELEKGNHVQKGRDVDEAIKEILDRKHPTTAMLEMAYNMESYIDKYDSYVGTKGPVLKAAIQRDLLLVRMITIQPLRIKMFKEMTYLDDNKGNLYKRGNGVWAIRFAPEDFKNQNGAANRPYDVPLPSSLSIPIEEYLKTIRPLFKDERPNVFVSMEHSRKPKDRNTLFLNNAFITRTRQFLPECKGFGPHAVRHIVATDYIKNNPNGFQVAADVLHDKVQTVLDNYAHIKAADGHRFYQEYFDTVNEEWMKAA